MSNYIYILLKGLPISISLMLFTICIGIIISLICTFIIKFKVPVIFYIVKIYIILFTGTPLMVQMFLIYYGPSQFIYVRETYWLWNILSNPWICAVLALSLNSAAYTTQLFYGSICSIPSIQWQSCAALGMNNRQSFFLLMPYAFKRIIPSYSNEITIVLKSTSLSYTITLMDIMGYSKMLYGMTYDFKIFYIAGIIYLFINGILNIFMSKLEKSII